VRGARSWRVALALDLVGAALGALLVGAGLVGAVQLAEHLGRRIALPEATIAALQIVGAQLPLGGALVSVAVAAWVGRRWERAGWMRALGASGVGPGAGVLVAGLVTGAMGLLLVALRGAISGREPRTVALVAGEVLVRIDERVVLLRGDALPLQGDAGALVLAGPWEPHALIAIFGLPLLAALAGAAGLALGVRARWLSAAVVAAALSGASLWLELAVRDSAAGAWSVGWLIGPPATLAAVALLIAVPRLSGPPAFCYGLRPSNPTKGSPPCAP